MRLQHLLFFFHRSCIFQFPQAADRTAKLLQRLHQLLFFFLAVGALIMEKLFDHQYRLFILCVAGSGLNSKEAGDFLQLRKK